MNTLLIEQRPVGALVPFANNARTHSTSQVNQIAASIEEFGWTNPILIDPNNGIIAGHARLAAANKLKMAEVPVLVLSQLTDAQRRALVIADNQLALNAGWDEDLLRIELQALRTEDFHIDLLGFDETELTRLLADEASFTGDADEDAVPEPPAVPVSKTGDLWILGNHRVPCGDSTIAIDVARLLGDRKPKLTVSDPPYGIELDSEWRDRAGLNGCGACSGQPRWVYQHSRSSRSNRKLCFVVCDGRGTDVASRCRWPACASSAAAPSRTCSRDGWR